MTDREAKLARARQLIAADQEAGRRRIAAELRKEFKVGLRDSVILALQREAYPERAQVIVQPYQLGRPLETRYKPRRQGRYNKLVKANFTPQEARTLSHMPLTVLPFVKNMVKARKDLMAGINREAQVMDWSKAKSRKEILELIDYTYKDSGWADLDDKNNPYSMLRQFRREAIKAGLWDPKDSPWRKKQGIRNKMFSSRWKGDTVGQSKRYRKLNRERILQDKSNYRQKLRDKKAKAR